MGSKLGNILQAAAPLALNYFVPGLGSAIGSSILGAGATGAETLGGGLLGAGIGAATGGGAKGALIGGLSGGIAPNIGNVGTAANPGSGILGAAGRNIPGVYDAAQGLSDVGSGLSSIFNGGSSASSLASHGSGVNADVGSGVNPGAAPAAVSGNSSTPSASVGGGTSSFSSVAPYLGIANSLYANNTAQNDLNKAGKQAQTVLNPYLSSGTAANSKLSDFLGTSGTPTSAADILASNPAYQFQLQQGNDALARKQAASGNYFSGGALQAAQDYGQGLANQTAQEYYSRLAQQSGQGLGAANDLAGVYGQVGSGKANAAIGSAGIVNQGLSNIFNANKNPYYDPITKTIKYA